MAIKILIGGSPCTYWSIAQTNGRETQAEGMGWELFKNYLIAKEKFKPDFFLYENNKSASQAIKDQIAREFGVGVDPNVRFTYINSALVSAQNRQRFYVTNFGDIEQPEDRGILLRDILETGDTDRAKAHAVISSAGRTTTREFLDKQQGTMALEPIYIGEVPEHKGTYRNGKQPSQQYRVYDTDAKGVAVTTAAITNVAEQVRIPEYGDADKARPLNAHYSNNCGGFEHRMFSPNPAKQQVDMIAESVEPEPVNATSDGKAHTVKAQYFKNGTANFVTNGGFGASAVAEPIRVGALPRPNGELSTSQAMQIYSQDGKSTTQMAGGGGLGGKTGLYAIPVEFEDGIPTKAVSCADGKTYPVYQVVDGLITIKGKEYPIKLKDGYYIIRKLTVRECARLQTMPDDYCKAVSDSQAYKALGNGWTAEVIIHLLNHALKDVPRDEEIIVLSLYDGIATGRYCLDKMGFTNVTYHAYEIDKYPIMVAMDNYPDIIQHGDAFAVREDDWQAPQTRSEWLDDLLGGVL